MLTAEVVCSWAERFNFIPSSRVVIQSIPPLSTALDVDFSAALEGVENWCKRRVFWGELDMLRPTLSTRSMAMPDLTFVTYFTYGVVERESRVPMKVRRKSPQEVSHRLLSVRFTWSGSGENIALAGSFNNWTAILPLHLSPSGSKEVIIQLSVGVYDYQFLVDGQWQVDPAGLVVQNEKGYTNRVYVQHPYLRSSRKTNRRRI